jgi:predicted lipid-binding transport protein (Tim44 family)
MGYHAGHQLVHWGETAPSGIHLRPGQVASVLGLAALAALFYRFRIKRNAAKAAGILAANADPAWNEEKLILEISDAFAMIQAAWMQGNLTGLRGMLEPRLYQEWEVRRAELRLDGSRHEVSDVTVHRVEIVNAKDYLDNAMDELTAKISFNATESFHRNKDAVRVENGLFAEYWKMGRSGKHWKVREITRDGILARMSLALEPTIKEQGKDGSNV